METVVRGSVRECKSIWTVTEKDIEVVRETGALKEIDIVITQACRHGLTLGLGLVHVHVHVRDLDLVAMMIGTEGHTLLEGLIHLKILSPLGDLAAQEGHILVHEEVVVGAGGKVALATHYDSRKRERDERRYSERSRAVCFVCYLLCYCYIKICVTIPVLYSGSLSNTCCERIISENR